MESLGVCEQPCNKAVHANERIFHSSAGVSRALYADDYNKWDEVGIGNDAVLRMGNKLLNSLHLNISNLISQGEASYDNGNTENYNNSNNNNHIIIT